MEGNQRFEQYTLFVFWRLLDSMWHIDTQVGAHRRKCVNTLNCQPPIVFCLYLKYCGKKMLVLCFQWPSYLEINGCILQDQDGQRRDVDTSIAFPGDEERPGRHVGKFDEKIEHRQVVILGCLWQNKDSKHGCWLVGTWRISPGIMLVAPFLLGNENRDM